MEADGMSPVAPPRGRWLRLALLVALLVGGALLLRFTPVGEIWEAEALQAALATVRDATWGPLLLVGLYLAVTPLALPVAPLILAGGALYGPVVGGLWNLLGIYLGAALTFVVARHLGRDVVAHWLGEERVAKVDALLDRHAFWSLIRLRFVPMPSGILSYGAALAGVRPSVFLGASLVGLPPAVWLLSWFAAELAAAATGERAGVLIRLAVVSTLLLLLAVFGPRLLSRRGRSEKGSPQAPSGASSD